MTSGPTDMGNQRSAPGRTKGGEVGQFDILQDRHCSAMSNSTPDATMSTTMTLTLEQTGSLTTLRSRSKPKPESAITTDYRESRRREHHEADIVIVGAGIVGCASAVAFGKQGRSVILLERSLEEPDRIVGELLQPGGVYALEKLGLRGMSPTSMKMA
jgi:hypothetical protein